MWRFILLSFVFLAWAFFEMSGGADYRASANSIQARALLDNQRPRARPLRTGAIELAQGTSPQAREAHREVSLRAALGHALAADATVTLAAADAPSPLPQIPLHGEAAPPEPGVPILDLRLVAGGGVNLRTGPGTQFGRLVQLQRGAQVEVLHDSGTGWVKLRVVESGRIGWMAERLLMVAN